MIDAILLLLIVSGGIYYKYLSITPYDNELYKEYYIKGTDQAQNDIETGSIDYDLMQNVEFEPVSKLSYYKKKLKRREIQPLLIKRSGYIMGYAARFQMHEIKTEEEKINQFWQKRNL